MATTKIKMQLCDENDNVLQEVEGEVPKAIADGLLGRLQK